MLYIPSQPMYSPCTLPYAPLCSSAPHYAPLSPSKTLLSPFLLLYATLQPIYTTLCSKVNFMEMHGWSRLNRTLIFNFQSKGANFRRVGWYVPPPFNGRCVDVISKNVGWNDVRNKVGHHRSATKKLLVWVFETRLNWEIDPDNAHLARKFKIWNINLKKIYDTKALKSMQTRFVYFPTKKSKIWNDLTIVSWFQIHIIIYWFTMKDSEYFW